MKLLSQKESNIDLRDRYKHDAEFRARQLARSAKWRAQKQLDPVYRKKRLLQMQRTHLNHSLEFHQRRIREIELKLLKVADKILQMEKNPDPVFYARGPKKDLPCLMCQKAPRAQRRDGSRFAYSYCKACRTELERQRRKRNRDLERATMCAYETEAMQRASAAIEERTQQRRPDKDQRSADA